MRFCIRLLLLWTALCSRSVYAGGEISAITVKRDLSAAKCFSDLGKSAGHRSGPISPDWIKDYSDPKIISESNYARLRKLLRTVNKRKDDLRVYVFIAPDLKASLPSEKMKELDLLALKKVIKNLASEKPLDWKKLEKDWDQFLFKGPNKDIKSLDNSLARRGYTDRIILYFQIANFHNPSTGKLESHIISKINIAGDKLEPYKEVILERARENVDLNSKFQERQKG